MIRSPHRQQSEASRKASQKLQTTPFHSDAWPQFDQQIVWKGLQFGYLENMSEIVSLTILVGQVTPGMYPFNSRIASFDSWITWLPTAQVEGLKQMLRSLMPPICKQQSFFGLLIHVSCFNSGWFGIDRSYALETLFPSPSTKARCWTTFITAASTCEPSASAVRFRLPGHHAQRGPFIAGRSGSWIFRGT